MSRIIMNESGEANPDARIYWMRFVDKWLGVPLCLVFSAIDIVAKQLLSRRPENKDNPNILIILLSEMGASVLSYTALKRLREKYPGANIYFLTFRKNRNISFLLDIAEDDRLLTLDHESPAAFVMDSVRSFFRMRRIKFDISIDFELFTRIGSVLSYLSGAAKKVGFYRYKQEGLYRGGFQTHKVAYNAYRHIGVNFLALIEALDNNSSTPLLKKELDVKNLRMPGVEIDQRKRERFREKLFLWRPGLKDAGKIILLNPSGGDLPIRAWPLENYVSLARRLLEERKYYVLLTGVPSDKKYNERLIERVDSDRCINAAGLTSDVEELMALFELSDILITNDGGPAIFASLTDIRVVVFFGPETPDLYSPVGGRVTVIYKPIQCSPCLTAFNHRNTACDGDNQCLKAITVAEVEKLVGSLLSGGDSRARR